jgi:hypothetical protein
MASAEETISEPDHPLDESDTQGEPKKWRTPGFQRMRLDWSSDDREVLNRAKSTAEGRLWNEFPEAYRLLYRIYDIVRFAEVDPETGEVLMDNWGLPRWKKDLVGSYLEDFSKLGIKEKEDILFTLTTHLVEWQQLAANAWGEAMFAKAQWEERFSMGYDAPMSGTIEARTAAGRLDSRDERYFALYVSMYSRKADALIRSLELLGQRIKDSMVG